MGGEVIPFAIENRSIATAVPRASQQTAEVCLGGPANAPKRLCFSYLSSAGLMLLIAVSADGKYSIEFAECLASCGFGPVCMVEDDFHEAVKPETAGELLAKYA